MTDPQSPRDPRSPLGYDPDLWDLLGAYGDEPVPEGFSRRVLQAVRLQRPALRRWTPLAAAAGVLLALGAFLLLRDREAPDPGASFATVLEEVPAEVLADVDVDFLLSLSDEGFDAFVAEALLASEAVGGGG
jgi:hypothetical protein